MTALERRHHARWTGPTGTTESTEPTGHTTLDGNRPANPTPECRAVQISRAKGLAAFAAVFTVVALFHTYESVLLVRQGVETGGTVVEIRHVHKISYADVVFTTSEGRRARAAISKDRWTQMPEVGDRVRVRYARSDPYVAADARQSRLELLLLPSAYWAGTLAVGIWAYRSRRRKAPTSSGIDAATHPF
jgi:hypothetical protein